MAYDLNQTTMNKPMSFDDMLNGFLHFYNKTIKAKKKSWEYIGPDITSNAILASSPTIKQQLDKEYFEYLVKEKDKEPMELFLTAAIQLGIQQGINLCKEQPNKYLKD